MYIYMVSSRIICIGLLTIIATCIIVIKTKPFKFLEYFDMESKCNHCCTNNSKMYCNQNCYENGVVCDCCRNYR